jgi:hypothetical protein
VLWVIDVKSDDVLQVLCRDLQHISQTSTSLHFAHENRVPRKYSPQQSHVKMTGMWIVRS